MRAQRLADGDGAVCAAGAADGDHQAALALALIQRDQIIDHRVQMGEERTGFLLAQHIVAHGRFETGVRADLLNIEGIGQETHVEHQVALARDAPLVAKGHDLRAQQVLALLLRKQRVDGGTGLFGLHAGGRKHIVRALAQRLEQLALAGNAFLERLAALHQRVITAGLLVPVDQRLGIRVQKEDGDVVAVDAAVDGLEDRLCIEQRAAAGIHAQCDRAVKLHLLAQRERLGEQKRGQIVHALIAVVLQMPEHAGLARAGQAGDDEKPHRMLSFRIGCAVSPCGPRPECGPPAPA